MSIAVLLSGMVKETIQRAGFFVRTLTGKRLDGLDLLERDHIGVEVLFLQWRFARSAGRKQQVFEEIKKKILTNGHLEESAFYPACDKFPELKRLVAEAVQNQKHFRVLFKEIEELTITSEKAHVKMKILMEDVKQHVNKEENQMFPRFRALAKKLQIDRLNRDLRLGRGPGQKKQAA